MELEPQRQRRGDTARARAQQVNHEIVQGAEDVPHFAWASQNVAATAMILRFIPEPTDPAARQIHHNLRGLLETVAEQQAESSRARRHEASGSRRSHANIRNDEASTRSGTSRCLEESVRTPTVSRHAPIALLQD